MTGAGPEERRARAGRTPQIGVIWAEAHEGIIGADGGMPWHVPEDLAHFRDTTMGAPVIMGRRTWESFPDRFRPLPGRRNIGVTRNAAGAPDGAESAGDLDEAIRLAGDAEAVWVIGGGELYRSAIDRADVLEVTELDLDVDGDTRAPARAGWPVAEAGEWQQSRSGIRYRFVRHERSAS